MAKRENTKTTEQEQGERAQIAALTRRYLLTQVMGWTVFCRACALTFLAQAWTKMSYSLQQIISPVIKTALFSLCQPWPKSPSNSKKHTHISQQTPASPADCCDPGSFPDQLQATAQHRENTHCWGNWAIIVTDGFTYSPPAWYFHGISKHWSAKDSQPFPVPRNAPCLGIHSNQSYKDSSPLIFKALYLSAWAELRVCRCRHSLLQKQHLEEGTETRSCCVIEMSLSWKLSQGPVCPGKKPNSHFILSLGSLCWCYCK